MASSNKLYGLDDKIEQLYKLCEVFLNSDETHIKKLSQLSIYPTFLFNGYPGTGKSSVASIIFERLKNEYNIDLNRLNIDELISHNFGESSSNLRSYFNNKKKEIEENNSYCFIIMDELDSFTVSRHQNDNDSIRRILLTFNTIIDELVRSNDIYRFIIIATTNIKEYIDTSILRRFYFQEGFNIEINESDFKILLAELATLANVTVEGSLSDMFKNYKQKRMTLGELKSIFSKGYINNLINGGKSCICYNDFSEFKTFHELALNNNRDTCNDY